MFDLRIRAALLSAGCLASARAADLHVPGAYPTIQAAIDVAENGDRILIAPGVYNEAFNLLGKQLTVAGAAAPSETQLNGAGLGVSIATCVSDEVAVFEFLSFTGGEGTPATHCAGQGVFEGRFGGAIYAIGGQLTVRDCIDTGF